ncbi:MAG: MarR family transcriptional regulator [bacterium]|jgi:DNA-binding MarR family transcriptional regulator|nr:MAG: transcriptional regulator [bacterium]
MNDSTGRQATTVDPTADSTMFALIHVGRALEARVEKALAEVGLSFAKHGVLRLLMEAGEPLPLGDLAARQSCVRSNMTQLVDRLEAEGLVRRVADPTDRRVIRAALTPEGRRRAVAGTREIERVRREFEASLSEADRAALGRLLAAIEA